MPKEVRRIGVAAGLAIAWAAASVALPAPSAPGPLETSVENARKMLVQEKLAEGIYVFRAPQDLEYWTATNTLVVINADDVTVFDSCTRAVTARAVIAEIRKLTPKPVRVLINSHWHQDHWSGNDEFAKAFPGLRIVATSETRDYMSHMGPRFFAAGAERGLNRRREALTKAIASGKLEDGSPLTPEVRAKKERGVAMSAQFVAEVQSLPRVLPNSVYRDELTFWSGKREFRLMSVTGDATASTVLYLPGDKVVTMGDVLVSPEDGNGPPPWTTNSYSVTPWLQSLRRLEALDAIAIVPGQGPTMRDKTYLRRTIELFASVIDQVHAALDQGKVKFSEVKAAVDADAIGKAYTPNAPLDEDFHGWVEAFAKKAMQEALDGAANLD